MALDNFRTIELIWDKANKSIIKTIKTASSDTTGRYFSVKVLDGGQEVTLNNAKLQLYWEHPNFNTSGTDDFNTVNNGGLFKMTFSKEMLTNVGELTAHLVLTLPDGKITSDGFKIEVIKGADDGVVVPTNSNGLVKQIEGKIDKGNVTLNDLTQEVKLAMTGGSVAVVGENAVGTENIKDGSISISKLDNQLKNMVDSRFTNKITNGDFSNGLVGWRTASGSKAELTTSGHVRISGTGESKLPRVLQGVTDGQVNGHKIYVSGSFMSENLSTDSLGFNIYRDNNVSYDIRLNHPEPNVWLQIGDIIEPDSGSGSLRVQPVAQYPSAIDAKDNSFLVDNIIVMDLTEIFGAGKEPTYKEVQNILGDTYFEGTLSVSELVKKEIKLANTDDDTTSNIPVNNTLPFSRDKFTSEELVLLDYNHLNLADKIGVFTRYTNPDTPTVVLNSTGDTSRLSSSLAQRTDLSEFDYIELHLNVKDQTQFSNLRVVLSTSTSDHLANDNLTHRLNEVKEDGYRVLRVPMSTFFASDGNPSLTSIETIRLVFSGGSVESPSSIEIIKISAVKGRKGAVYMQFDDGTIGQYKYAFPILEKYGLRGTIAVPTERVGQTVGLSGERPTWSQLREMQDAGWLVVSHGLDEKSLNSLSDEELDRQLRVSSQMLFDRGFTFGSKCIVAPQSAWDDRVERFARKYFAIARNRGYGTGPRRDVYPQNHHRYQKCMGPHGAPIEELKSWIDEAIQYKQEVTMSWHMVQPEEPAQNKTYWDTPERLEAVCAYIREKIDEGVLECVTWQDTMLQSMNTNSSDAKGNEYLVSKDSDLTLLKLPIYTD